MNEMIERGDTELVPEKSASNCQWYIPHHGVFHPKKPDKLRIVFDCSARYQSTSLNQHLPNGPGLTNGLAGVLVRFRRFPIAIMRDVEKMFHQFFVCEPDRDYLRFVWWEDGDMSSEPKDFRMRKHLFGAASSPACANYGLKHLAKCQEEQYPEAASFVQNDFYVDDGLTSVKNELRAVQLVKDARTVCSNGGLRLHQFVSNSKSVIESIPASERADDVKDLDLNFENLPVERALGVKWSIENDVFNFEVTVKNTLPSRRNMPFIVASIFDPLGFISPFVLTGKRILQEMCQTGVGWQRQIRTVRSILNAILTQHPGRLDDSSLRTIFYEVMAIVNSRPLTVSDINDPSASEALTPNHIFTKKSGIAPPPPGNFVREDLYAKKRWMRVQYVLEQFWSSWKREYIGNIALRQKWHAVRRNMRVGDIVLIVDSDLSRNQWPLAKVVEANSDNDGLVRRVRVMVGHCGSDKQTVLERSVHKLVLLVEKC